MAKSKVIAPVVVRELGTAGHFCGADNCRFHLHTHVGRWCISTVGDYFPPSTGRRETIGVGRFYETYVFDLKRSERRGRWRGVDFYGYKSARAAERGHSNAVLRWIEQSNIASGYAKLRKARK